jgi:hypothetical protein
MPLDAHEDEELTTHARLEIQKLVVAGDFPNVASLSDLKKWTQAERTFWGKALDESMAGNVLAQLDLYLKALAELDTSIERFTKGSEDADEFSEEEVRDNLLSAARRSLGSGLSKLRSEKGPCFMISTTAVGQTFQRLLIHQPSSQGAFLEGLKDKASQSRIDLYTPQDFDGYCLASFAKLSHVYAINGEGVQAAVDGIVRNTQLRIETQVDEVRAIKEECATIRRDYNSLLDEVKAKNEKFTEQTAKKETEYLAMLANNEAAFKKHAMLAGPAAYWKELFETYQMRGQLNGMVAIVVGLVGIIGAAFLIAGLHSFQAGNTFETYRVSALLAFAATLLLLLLQLFIRLTLSSMHLSRDAMERYQLTHVFLALVKEGAIQREQGDLILAALFSRSDTGLLKNDGTPSMPANAILESLLKKQG